MKKILITGGSGLVGRRLSEMLLVKGYEVVHLSRKAQSTIPGVKAYIWNIPAKQIDGAAFAHTDAIVHLAGEGIADKAWTARRKAALVNSRVQSADLLHEYLRSRPHQVKTLVSASAIGIYTHQGDEWMREYDASSPDFLGQCCQLWEQAADQVNSLGIRVVKLRTGIVLSRDGGALPPLARLARLGMASPVGNGRQWMSWIHLDDLCRLYIRALEDEGMSGPYNAVAPGPLRNREFMRTLAKTVKRPFWPIPVPVFLLQLALGERAQVLLDSTRVSFKKTGSTGFVCTYPTLPEALGAIWSK
jgi:uncharacterized protein (TIGR01777 family)